MLASISSTLSAQTQLPSNVARTHFPDLHDPELDGGVSQQFSRGDVTPDGRLIIAYRKIYHDFPTYDGLYETYNAGIYPRRIALTVASLDPSVFPQGEDHLVDFSDGVEPGDVDYFFRDDNGTPGGGVEEPDWVFVHWGMAVKEAPPGTPGTELIPMTDSPFWVAPSGGTKPDLMYDDAFPHPFEDRGSSMISIAMRSTYGDYRLDQSNPPATGPMPGEPLPGNPHASDQAGQFLANGDHKTYHLWLVRLHGKSLDDPAGVKLTAGTETNDPLVLPDNPIDDGNGKSLYCQDLRVVVDPSGEVVSAEIGRGAMITTPHLVTTENPEGSIRALEPTVTADGKLIMYNGGGAEPNSEGDNGRVTYVYNAQGCVTSGWTEPETITKPPALADTGYATMDEFKARFKIFATEIRLPPSSVSKPGHVFQEGESVRGPYPWVSRDGSFYIAGGSNSNEAVEGQTGNRAGTYVCGEITGGYIKLIDGNGVNPTRHGAPWTWPLLKAKNSKEGPSERSVLISPGLSPGPWEFLPDQDVPLPSQVATRAIPIMPLVFTNNDTYGEIRFEEADGHYLLYMPCNESFVGEQTGLETDEVGKPPFLYETSSTPDTSGRSLRAYGALNAGAAFPREAYENNSKTRNDLQADIGAAYTANTDFYDGYTFTKLHVNLGFRGQGIVMNDTGRIQLEQEDLRLTEQSQLTVQLFVKRTASHSGGDVSLFEYQAIDPGGQAHSIVKVGLDNGVPYGQVLVQISNPPYVLPARVDADFVLSEQNSLTDNKEGWHHLAMVFDETSLVIWVDGVSKALPFPIPRAPIPDPPPGYTTRTVVGPGDGTTVTQVTDDNATLVIDEVAVSDVVRTEWEIRRDACVELPDDGFEAAPAALASQLPEPFEANDVKWPAGEPYSQAVVDLGNDLFHDTILGILPGPTGHPSQVRPSCTTCHIPGESFVQEGQGLAQGLSGSPLPFNTPTLLNAGLGGHKTFSGRAASLEEQVVFPLTSAEEMGNQTMSDVVARLNASPYATEFDAAFGTSGVGATADTLKRSLAMYMRTLYDGDSPLDQETLSPLQEEGKALFFGKARCSSCHTLPNLTDEDFHNVMTVLDTSSAPDRASFTSRTIDVGALKTPTLRGLSGTGPYFHNGSVAELEDVVRHYNKLLVTGGTPNGTPDRHLRPLDLSEPEIASLVAFLMAL